MADVVGERLRAAMALHQAGRLAEAARAYRDILRRAPRHAEALHLLGLVEFAGGDFEAGRDAVQRAIALKPKEALFHANLGLAFLRAGRPVEAVAPLRRAVALDPTPREPHDQLAGALVLSGDPQAAIAVLTAALARFPADAHVATRLSAVCLQIRDIAGAERAADEALRRAPRDANALVNRGLVDVARKDYEPSLARFGAALEIAPAHVEAQNNYAYSAGILADFTAQERVAPLIQRRITAGAPGDSWSTLAEVAYLSPYLRLPPAIHRQTLHLLATRFPAVAALPAPAIIAARGERPLRIGYVSAGFGNHAIGHVTRSFYAAQDRDRFAIYGYPILDRGHDESGYFAAIRAGFDEWRPLTGLDDAAAAAQIRGDAIDILVDLNGFLEGRRPAIFAHRPAPVQLFWLAHAGGLGLPFIDYLIGDTVVAPLGEERLYRERLVRLPEIYHCADRYPIAEEPPSAAAEGLAGASFVFCAFNNPQKLDRQCFAAWLRILAAVPDSMLWLSDPSGRPALRANLRALAAAAGIAGERIVFAGRVPSKSTHLARHRLAGLFLDTFTVNAATTALDALWAGLPVVTLRGDRWASRMAETMVRAVGLGDDLVAGDVADYERRAIALARDPMALSELSGRLATLRHERPLFDIARFARHLERAYEGMWQGHLAGRPAAFDVAPI